MLLPQPLDPPFAGRSFPAGVAKLSLPARQPFRMFGERDLALSALLTGYVTDRSAFASSAMSYYCPTFPGRIKEQL